MISTQHNPIPGDPLSLFSPQVQSILSSYEQSTVLKRVDVYSQYNMKDRPEPPFSSLHYIHNIIEVIKERDLRVAGRSHELLREIHKNEYEGGFLLWECERDAVQYTSSPANRVQPLGAHVLEIGCGSGLLGIRLLQMGCASLTFQDYNLEVLQYWTLPNLLLNFNPGEVAGRCRFVKGDWRDLQNERTEDHIKAQGSISPSPQKYEIICGCDIIYETIHYEILLNLFDKFLTHDGRVIISSKAYYYGNGGSIAEFKQSIKDSGKFAYELLHVIDTGNSNRREIFQVVRLAAPQSLNQGVFG